MKRTPIKTSSASATPARGASDTLCKRLAEAYPAQFARWLFGAGGKVKVEKTELSREPIRADAVIFSRGERETLHAEFQTTMTSEVPAPLRLLDYYVGLKRQQPNRRVRQVLVVLKPTGQEIPDRYSDCGLQIADCGFAENPMSSGNPKSEIRNPKSEGDARPHRVGGNAAGGGGGADQAYSVAPAAARGAQRVAGAGRVAL